MVVAGTEYEVYRTPAATAEVVVHTSGAPVHVQNSETGSFGVVVVGAVTRKTGDAITDQYRLQGLRSDPATRNVDPSLLPSYTGKRVWAGLAVLAYRWGLARPLCDVWMG